MDISNGENIGVALFVQGCHFKCKNCFNPETWNFDSGREWTSEIKEKFLELIDRPYIKRVAILGGEPLAEENLNGVLNLVSEINIRYNAPLYIAGNKNIMSHNSDKSNITNQRKTIWIYTGYKWEHIFDQRYYYHPQTQEKLLINRWERQQIVSQCDVLVDGQYIEYQKDLSLKWKGSKNQRIIDIQKSLQQKKVVLWD